MLLLSGQKAHIRSNQLTKLQSGILFEKYLSQEYMQSLETLFIIVAGCSDKADLLCANLSHVKHCIIK